jgi:catechol 2,3-dioxygenase-like lactoylglutathione lyase family enzyme
VLGFRTCFESRGDRWSRVGLAVDELVLELFSPFPGGSSESPDMMYPGEYRRPKIALTVADVDAAHAALTAGGVLVLGPVCVTAVSRLIFVLDPDGTMVQLHQFDGGHLRVGNVLGAMAAAPERRVDGAR